jgi:hypothetical protein
MNAGEQSVRYKIPPGGGKSMLGVALFLDVLPITISIGAVALLFMTLAGTACGDAIATAQQGGVVGGAKSIYYGTICAVGSGLSAIAGIWVAPLLHLVATFAVSLIAMLLFPTWFFFKGYHMVSLHPKKAIVNFVSVTLTALMKWVPVVNLFPTPVYTLTVWTHIKISQKEDMEAHQKALGKLRARETRNASLQGRAPRQIGTNEIEREMAKNGMFVA